MMKEGAENDIAEFDPTNRIMCLIDGSLLSKQVKTTLVINTVYHS